MKSNRIIVAVESYLLRKGLLAILHRIGGISVTREFDSAEELVLHQKNHGIPYLVITESLYEKCEELFIAQPDLLERTLLLAVTGRSYSNQDKPVSHVITLGETKEQILEHIRHFLEMEEKQSGQDELTEREKTIVRLVSMGMTNKQIADHLFLSTHTVTTHRKNISAKLGIKSASGLAIYAIVNNLITIEEASDKQAQ